MESKDKQDKDKDKDKGKQDRHRSDIDYAAIGQRLRIARQRCGLSVLEASKKTDISPGAISALELNRKNVGLVTLFAFCRAYGVGLDEIVFGIEPSADSQVSTSERENGDGSSSSVVEETVEDTDPYYRSLREILDGCDDAEKDFMLRLISTAHSEFAIVRNKMK